MSGAPYPNPKHQMHGVRRLYPEPPPWYVRLAAWFWEPLS